MAGLMKYVKENYPDFFREVSDRRNDIDTIRETYAKSLPEIEASVTAYARDNNIPFKFNF